MIYRHTDGVPRRINGLCSRLLLYGFLEEIHTILAADVERLALELRAELSTVAVVEHNSHPAPLAAPSAQPEALTGRLVALERATASHQRTIKRLIEIMASHFKGANADEPS